MRIHRSLRNAKLLELVVRPYLKGLRELEGKYPAQGCSHFDHVSRNIAQQLYILEGTDFTGEDLLAHFRTQRTLESYLRLLRLYTEFLDSETQTTGGYFPDIHLDVTSYIEYAASMFGNSLDKSRI